MRTPLIVLVAAAFLLAACGDRPSGRALDDTAPEPGGAPGGQVQTALPATVLDDGDGAELCLGGVAESLPPQCSGLSLVGWDWAAQDGFYDEANGVRWGLFHVVGTYDGGGQDGTFTVEQVTPAAVWQGPAPEDPFDLSTPCPEPDGGWQVVDPALTNQAAQDEAFAVAQGLEGYAGAWLDQSINPASERLDDPGHEFTEEDELAMNDPALTIINIRVTGDVAAAEAELRKVWGGSLCVTQADRTEAELVAIQDRLAERPDMLGSATDVTTGTVELSVIHDDGTLQAALDDEHGEGVVRVDSALVPLP